MMMMMMAKIRRFLQRRNTSHAITRVFSKLSALVRTNNLEVTRLVLKVVDECSECRILGLTGVVSFVLRHVSSRLFATAA